LEIIETDKYGLANTIDGKIFIHPKLNEFPELRERIIRHEREHRKTKGFWKNRKIDAFTELKFKDVFPFYKLYPKVFFKQHFPITYSDGNLYIEWSLLFLYILCASVGFTIIWLITIFSTNSMMFWSIMKNIVLVGIITIIVLYGLKILKDFINKEALKKQ